MKNWKNILIIVLALLLLVGGIFAHCSIKKSNEKNELYEASMDTLRYSADSSLVMIDVLQASNKKSLLNLKTKDSTIQWLQSTVKDYEGKLQRATVASTVTNDVGVGETVVTHTDTIWHDSIAYVHSTYSDSWIDRWSIGNIVANKDSITRDIKILNEYEFTEGYSPWNPFKKRELKIQMKNLNPNTVTTELRTFSIKQSEKRFGIGPYAGYGINISPSGEFHHGFQIGVGLTWRIWP